MAGDLGIWGIRAMTGPVLVLGFVGRGCRKGGLLISIHVVTRFRDPTLNPTTLNPKPLLPQ